MCDMNKIGGFLAAAAAAVIIAVALFATAAVLAGSYWTAFGNTAVMAAAAISIGAALALVNASIGALGSCSGSCGVQAAQLRTALIGAATSLTVLLAATILGIFGASIPWAGIAVAVGLSVGGVACGISLGVAAFKVRDLGGCLGGAALPVANGAAAITFIAAIAIGILGAFALLSGSPTPG